MESLKFRTPGLHKESRYCGSTLFITKFQIKKLPQ